MNLSFDEVPTVCQLFSNHTRHWMSLLMVLLFFIHVVSRWMKLFDDVIQVNWFRQSHQSQFSNPFIFDPKIGLNFALIMSSAETWKPRAVCVPYPSHGHVTPMMRLAKLLHSRGFHITFVNTEFNHRRLIRSKGLNYLKGLPDFWFETIPDGLPHSDRDATQDVPALCDSTRKRWEI